MGLLRLLRRANIYLLHLVGGSTGYQMGSYPGGVRVRLDSISMEVNPSSTSISLHPFTSKEVK